MMYTEAQSQMVEVDFWYFSESNIRLSSGSKKPHEEITVTHKAPREILRLFDGPKSPIQKKS